MDHAVIRKRRKNGDPVYLNIRRPFEKFVDRRQCAAVMQREEVTYAKL
jgi:hypothetical protein